MKKQKKRKIELPKNKENIILATLITGVILLSLGIGIIKFLPKLGTTLIIIGSSLVYISVIVLVFIV